MNVFVLGTGRCGSTALNAACGHMTNFTLGHEARARLIGRDRVDYPDNHIEIDHRLAWFLGRLDEKYGDDAYYVHLTRNRDACARTQARHWSYQGSMIMAWHNAILKMSPVPRLDAAGDLVDAVTENISFFLKDKSNKMDFRIENAEMDFPKFWNWIGAKGDLDAAMLEFKAGHNETGSRTNRAVIIATHFASRAFHFYR